MRSDNRNPGCSSPTGADGEICSLQNFGSANAAKGCAQCQLSSFATNERDSRRIILVTIGIFEKQDYPSPQSSPRTRGEAEQCIENSFSATVAITTRAHVITSACKVTAQKARLSLSERERTKVRVSRRACSVLTAASRGSASMLGLQFQLIHAIHGRALLIGALQSPVGGINPHPPLSLGKGEATIRMHRVQSI